jgi:hypothetical protein
MESVPEPPPQPRGVIVPNELIEYMVYNGGTEWEDLCILVVQRDAFGRKKYGQPLMNDDGRNGVEDARQEAGDFLQYAFKEYLNKNKEGLNELRQLIYKVEHVVTSLYMDRMICDIEEKREAQREDALTKFMNAIIIPEHIEEKRETPTNFMDVIIIPPEYPPRTLRITTKKET